MVENNVAEEMKVDHGWSWSSRSLKHRYRTCGLHGLRAQPFHVLVTGVLRQRRLFDVGWRGPKLVSIVERKVLDVIDICECNG